MAGMKTRIEKGDLSKDAKNRLEWLRVRTGSSRGIVFAPPLIGGNRSLQVMTFRRLILKGYDLISFSYSGHGNSTDKFSLGATFRDTLLMLHHARELSRRERMPLLGVASCYAAIPCLYAAHKLSEPFRRLVLINALPRLGAGSALISFLNYYRKMVTEEPGRFNETDRIEHYLDFLFPGIMKGKDHFGVLERKRTRLGKTLTEFMILNPLRGVKLHRTPVLCLYASQDRILEIYHVAYRDDYERHMRRLCPNALFHALEGDHYLMQEKTRVEAIGYMDRFFNCCPMDGYSY